MIGKWEGREIKNIMTLCQDEASEKQKYQKSQLTSMDTLLDSPNFPLHWIRVHFIEENEGTRMANVVQT